MAVIEKGKMMKLTFLTAVAVGALIPTIAFGQTTGAERSPGSPQGTVPEPAGSQEVPTTTAPTGDPSTQLEDIVVTAQKRSENVQKVPIAITAVSSAQLATSGVTNITQLNVAVPAVNTRVTIGSFQPSIRGVGTSGNNVENPVALYIDGVYYASQREGLRELNDIEQLSVLKGPQGTLFGRNATGGVIQITTKRPSFTTAGEIGVSLDNYLRLKTDAYLTGGLTGTIAASLSLAYQTQGDGWGTNFTTGNDTFRLSHYYSARGKLLFELSDKTDFTLIGDYQDRSGTEGSYYNPFPGYAFTIPGYVPLGNDYSSTANVDGVTSLKSGGLSGTLKSDLGFATLTSITAFRKARPFFAVDGDGTAADLFRFDATNHQTQFSQEVQLVSPSAQDFHWSVGAYYLYFKNDVSPFNRNYNGIVAQRVGLRAQVIDVAEKTDSVSPFAQIDFSVIPGTRVTLGIRETFEHRSLEGTNTLTLLNGAQVVTRPNNSFRKNSPSWRASLDQRVTDDILAYASYNRGFKSGGYNVGNPANPPYRPEKLDAYELGLKTQLFDRRLRLNAAGFFYKYDDLQLFQFVTGSTVPLLVNAAKSELYGLDADFEARITPEFRISGGLLLMHSSFKDFPNPTAALANARGNRLQLAQNFNGTITGTYTKQLAFGEIALSVTESHNGNYFFEPDNLLRQKAYDILNATVSWTSLSQSVTVSAFARNLTDSHVIQQAYTLGPVGRIAAYGSEPRVGGVSARFRF
jgi:outer membrane receptor protein involved in Fe transport